MAAFVTGYLVLIGRIYVAGFGNGVLLSGVPAVIAWKARHMFVLVGVLE